MGDDYTFTVKGNSGVEGLTWQPITIAPQPYPTTITTGIKQEKPTVSTEVKANGGGFTHRNKPDKKFRAEKVTKDNVRELALQAGRRVGGEVISDEGFFVVNRSRFDVGDWVVEGFNYETNVPTYRKATLAEREEYDLR